MIAIVGLASWSIWVSAPVPPVTPACALADDVAAAIGELVPEAKAHAGAAAGAGELRLVVDPGATGVDGPGGAAVDVVLSDAGGAQLLERALPAAGSCPELAESVALVIERYLSDLGVQAGDVSISRSGTGTGTGTGTETGTEKRTAVSGGRTRLMIGGRVELAFGGVQPGAAVGAMLGRGAVAAGVEVGASWPRSEDVTRDGGMTIGAIDLSSVHVLAGVGGRRGRGLAAVWLGGERIGASAGGDAVFQRVDESGWQALVRGDVGYDLPLTGRLVLRAQAGVELRPSPVDVRIEGSSQDHASPPVRGVVGAGLTWSPW